MLCNLASKVCFFEPGRDPIPKSRPLKAEHCDVCGLWKRLLGNAEQLLGRMSLVFLEDISQAWCCSLRHVVCFHPCFWGISNLEWQHVERQRGEFSQRTGCLAKWVRWLDLTRGSRC